MYRSILITPSSIFSLQEIYYYCGKPKKVDHTNITGDSIALTANTKVDDQSLAKLTSEQGPLHSGVLPGVDCTSAEGEKAVWQAIGNNPVSKMKKEKPEREPAEQVTPKTPKESCPQLLQNTGLPKGVVFLQNFKTDVNTSCSQIQFK